MASMNRNVNLEEINTDAFMGISFLNYQSLPQKAIFIGGIVAAIAINLVGTFVFDISMNISMFLTFIPLLIGTAFGGNYNEDLSLIQYFRLLISKPSKAYYSKPVEDLEQLHNSEMQIRKEEELRKQQQEKLSDEAQKKLLIKMGIIAAISIIIFIALVVVLKATKKNELHHTIQEVSYIEVGSENA